MTDTDRLAGNPPASGRSATAGLYALSAILLLRAAVNGVMTIWLLTHGTIWSQVFDAGSVYSLIDGALGLVTAPLLSRRQPVGAPPILVAIVVTDAVIRIAIGLAIRVFPGLAMTPITIVLFFGALGVWAATAGAIAIAAWILGHEHHRRGKKRTRVHALFDPLSAAGLVALALALYALTLGPPATARSLRIAGAVVSGTLTVVLLAALVLEVRSVMTTRDAG